MREVRPDLRAAAEPFLRRVAALHANLVQEVAIQATTWNLPPDAGHGRARPELAGA